MQETKNLVSLAEFIKSASSKYYSKKIAIGKDADFITSPEISQLFGYSVALWAINLLQKLSYPQKVNIVELGPGRGTLMSDILSIFKKFKLIQYIDKVILVDINKSLKQIQKAKLTQYENEVEFIWKKNIDNLEDSPTIFIANEFFDCLPIRQFIFQDKHWREVMVDMSFKPEFVLGDIVDLKYQNAKEGNIVEICEESCFIITKIASHIIKNKGGALIIDYGYFEEDCNFKSSVQSVKNHKYQDVFASLGNSDISVHVNFSKLKHTAQNFGLKEIKLKTQRDFLLENYIESLAYKAYEKADVNKKINIALSLDRLIGENKMGVLFKVLELA